MKRQTKLGLVLAAAALITVAVASVVTARGWVQQGADWYYVGNDGEFVTDTIQASGNTKFYLGEDGAMQKDYFLEDYNSSTYYFGSNGAMVTNTWVAIESDRVSDQGDYVPDNYWYYFQASGKAIKGTSDTPKKTTIDGKKYMFNQYGQMCTGWIRENGEVVDPDGDEDGGPFTDAWYYAGGDNDGVLRSGWVTYYDGWNGSGEDYQTDKTNLYFYFNTTNNKKYGNTGAVTKKINGKTYAFDSNGMMLSGWDVVNNDFGLTTVQNNQAYFSGDDDGHQVKKGWVYTVPAASIDSGAYDDGEDKYMYYGSSGAITKDQFKKINGKYYVFNSKGIMKTGVVIWAPNRVGSGTKDDPHFVGTLDLDWAEGSEVSKKGMLRYDKEEDDYIYVGSDGTVINVTGQTTSGISDGNTIKLHLFGDDGARKTGTNNVNFADDTYSFTSNASGHKASGVSAKKYYSLGIQLKASADIKYGIYSKASFYSPMADDYATHLLGSDYLVLTTSGSKQKGANTAKKDADGNYWLINKLSSALEGIWTVDVKYSDSKITWYSNTFSSTDENTYYDKAYLAGLVGKSSISAKTYYKITDKTQLPYFSVHSGQIEYIAEDVNTNDFYLYPRSFTKFNDEEYASFDLVAVGYFYKSDFGDKSNYWIPFGICDCAGNTARLEYDGDTPDKFYQVIPNNDYFLNCYWN